ncbi:MAG: hypothetical protein GEU86_06965 [Actinophytocola sp.]|nr:hypothetical protein [Actinophytocola sp.]
MNSRWGFEEDDAKLWDQAANDLNDPKHAVGPLTLDGANDVTGLGQRMGIDATYEQARAKVEQLLGEGQEYLGRLADTLLAVAADYEAREHASESSFKQKDVEGN